MEREKTNHSFLAHNPDTAFYFYLEYHRKCLTVPCNSRKIQDTGLYFIYRIIDNTGSNMINYNTVDNYLYKPFKALSPLFMWQHQ